MAVTITTISRPAGWTSGQVITQLEEAMAAAGLHGPAITGLVAGPGYCPSPSTFGGTVGTVATTYRDIEPISTSGSGVGATFNIQRANGKITAFPRVNRPGRGYVDGDTVTISANSIGGSVNGATDITFPIFVASDITGAQTYNFSYTGDFILSGTDRLGSFSNVTRTTPRTITVMEGDTLVFTRSSVNNGWGIYFLAEDGRVGNLNAPMSPVSTINEGQGGDGTTTWVTRPTQAGTYYISGANTVPAISHDIVVLPRDGSRTFTPRSWGTTTTFFDKQTTPGLPFPWGVMRQVVQAGKKYGDTYRSFQISNQGRLEFGVGSSFMPINGIANTFDGRFKGSIRSDISRFDDTSNLVQMRGDTLWSYNGITSSPVSPTVGPTFGQAGNSLNVTHQLESFCSANAGNSFSLDLIVYRSALDPSFSVFSYKQPNLSSTNIKSNSFLTFFLHNFTNNIWDLDYVFLSGLTTILSTGGNTNEPELTFRTHCCGAMDYSGRQAPSVRAAEFGYVPMGNAPNADENSAYDLFNRGFKDAVYRATSNPRALGEDNESYRENTLYYRTNQSTDLTNRRGIGLPDESNFNAIIRGIPLNTTLVPTPYYLPDDFVLVLFDNATPSLNIQQGDRLIVEEDIEEYVIITGSYNQSLRTRGILFCARIV